jgi:hypothetical protein
MHRTLLAAFMLLLLPVFSIGQTPTPKGTVCWPLHFAGITVGVTSDQQVQRLLGGPGVARPDEGHTGGRYYIDTKHEFTLHIELGVDRIVESVTVSRGVSPLIKNSERKVAVGKWFEPHEGFGNWRGLHLGSTNGEVTENLGEPQEKQADGSKWVYQSTCSCDLPDFLSIGFKDDEIVELSLWMEE